MIDPDWMEGDWVEAECVGGPMDGERVRVNRRASLRIPLPSELKAAEAPDPYAHLRVGHYEWRTHRTTGERCLVWQGE